MLGAGAVAVAIAVVIIVVVALNLTGSSETGASAAAEFPPYAHTIGDANAPVTVVEFGDFQ